MLQILLTFHMFSCRPGRSRTFGWTHFASSAKAPKKQFRVQSWIWIIFGVLNFLLNNPLWVRKCDVRSRPNQVVVPIHSSFSPVIDACAIWSGFSFDHFLLIKEALQNRNASSKEHIQGDTHTLYGNICCRIGFNHQSFVVDEWYILTWVNGDPWKSTLVSRWPCVTRLVTLVTFANHEISRLISRWPGPSGFCDAPIFFSLQVEDKTEAITRSRQHRGLHGGPTKIEGEAVSMWGGDKRLERSGNFELQEIDIKRRKYMWKILTTYCLLDTPVPRKCSFWWSCWVDSQLTLSTTFLSSCTFAGISVLFRLILTVSPFLKCCQYIIILPWP